MKYTCILLLAIFALTQLRSQTEEDPVFWSHDLEQLSDEEYELTFRGRILKGWHVYSQFTAEGGSLPSIFTYVGAGEDYELLGKTEEGPTVDEYSDIFEITETFFVNEALFKQRIRILNKDINHVEVNLYYQVCKEVCIPKEVDFFVALDGSEFVGEEKSVDEASLALSMVQDTLPSSVYGSSVSELGRLLQPERLYNGSTSHGPENIPTSY